jgi:hypothetical protein
MNKIVRFLQNYLLIGAFFVAILLGWSLLLINSNIQGFVKFIHEVLSWNFIIWFATLFIFLIMLVVFPVARENTLKRLANLKERDEREQYITGKAARASYIATLSLMIFLFFMSIFSLHIYHFSNANDVSENGKGHHWEIGFNVGFSLFDKPEINNNPITHNTLSKSEIFNSEKITPSKSAMILILLLWQLLIFNITTRKEL